MSADGVRPTDSVNYSITQKWLHNISVLMISWLMGSGYLVTLIDRLDPFKESIVALNASLAFLFTPLFFIGVYVSFGKSCRGAFKPRSLMSRLAFAVHTMIYLATVTVLISGFLMMRRDIIFFDCFSIPHWSNDVQMLERFASVHSWACVALALLLVLHMAAVIKHQLAGKSVIKRMLF